MSFIGKRVPRKEDARLVAGRGRYLADITMPGMLHAVFLRSPHAHAVIVRIDTSQAEQVAGVVTIVTYRDLAKAARALPILPPHPALHGRNYHLLAGDRTRFAGEGVAVVVAESRAAAETARDLIEVTFEPLPSAQTLSGAGVPAVHHDIPDNVAGKVTLRCGDVDRALVAAPHVVKERLVISRGGGQPIETRGVVASYSPASDLLTVWASSQVPHQIRQVSCELLGLPTHAVRVIAPDVGGGFGAKLIVYPEDVLIPWLAHRLAQPVRWIEDRLEHMLTATQERAQEHDITIGFDDSGRLLALRDHFLHDNGAYAPRGLVVPLLSASMLPGPYRVDNVEVTLQSMYTHRVPVTPYRGAGQPQAVFVIERILDRIARELGLDRAAVRMTNLVRPHDMPYDTGLTNYRNAGSVIYDTGDYPAVFQHALDLAGYPSLLERCAAARAAGTLRGVGIACHVELTGVGPYEGALMRVDAAGRICVFTGVTSQGQGLETTLAQIAATELGVTPDEVEVVAGDTLGIDQGIGTFASRAAVAGGNAVALAARDVRSKARSIAARVLDVPEHEIEQDGPQFFRRGRTNYTVGLAELAQAAAFATADHGMDPGLEATRYFQPPDLTFSSGAHVALVEVDAETGHVDVLDYWICHDSGLPINPMVVEGQLHGAAALGIASALLESVHYDGEGQLQSGSFMDYALPRASDIPSFTLAHLETPSPRNPLGLRGVGESGALPVPAAIASAIDDALGTRVTEMPLTLAVRARLLAAARTENDQ